MEKMADATTFVAPPRLVTARRKQENAGDDGVGDVGQDLGVDGFHAFFTAQEYARHSALGGAVEARRYQQQQQQSRQTLLSPGVEAARVDGVNGKKADSRSERKSKHAMVLLEELMLQHFADAGEQVALATNSRRRISALTIEQHEEYLVLVRKRAEAHSRGLPEILALTADEAAQLRALEQQARDEQTIFFKTFRRVTAPVRARNQSSVPPFADRWLETLTLRNTNEARRLYAQFFEPALSIPIDSTKQPEGVQATTGDTTVKHVKEVLRIGTAAMIDAHQLAPGMRIGGLSEDTASGQGSSLTVRREVISADPHAEGLMLKYDCDIAVSSSTLLALFDATTTSAVSESVHSWVIPVKSRVVVSNDGSPKKLVSLDRPLLSPDISIRDKIALAGRSVVMDQLVSTAGTAHETTGQTAYHVWEIGGKRVLVRIAIHGYIMEHEPADPASGPKDAEVSSGSNAKRSVALSLFVKPDYHDVGLKEQLTASERCKFWLHSWLRGSSRVLVARFDPRTSVIAEWEPHSLKTLIYGKSGEGQAQHADFFDPMMKFDVLARLVTCLCDLSGGDYLIRPSSHDKQDRRLDILSSTTSQNDPSAPDNGDDKVQIDLYHYLDKDSVSEVEMASIVEAVLPEWYRHDRIPYTFRTGTYCQEFFQDGVCSLLGSGQYCEGRHIQLEASKSAASKWCFKDITEVLRRGKHVENRKRPPGRPAKLSPSFPFCAGGKISPAAVVANSHAPVKCRKKGCQLRHLTAHEIAERVADAAERAERGKRREYKKGPKTRGGRTFDERSG